jgi:hypothetical protein
MRRNAVKPRMRALAFLRKSNSVGVRHCCSWAWSSSCTIVVAMSVRNFRGLSYWQLHLLSAFANLDSLTCKTLILSSDEKGLSQLACTISQKPDNFVQKVSKRNLRHCWSGSFTRSKGQWSDADVEKVCTNAAGLASSQSLVTNMWSILVKVGSAVSLDHVNWRPCVTPSIQGHLVLIWSCS